MQSMTLQIPVVNEDAEVERIVAALRALPGVSHVEGHRRTKYFTLTWTEPTTVTDIRNTLIGIGYTPDLP
jgi:hypothetical protein